MSRRQGRRPRRLVIGRSSRPPSHRPRTPDHAVGKRPGELTLDVQGAVGEVAVGNQCVVAVCIQRPYLRRVFVPTAVLVSGDSAVGDELGT
jgi:hypothetical protein